MHQGLDEEFGELRSLLYEDGAGGEEWRKRLWALLDRAYEKNPGAYTQAWVPYMESFPQHWEKPVSLWSVNSLMELERSVKMAPFGLFTLLLDEEFWEDAYLREFFVNPLLLHVVRLDFDACLIGDEGVYELARSEMMENLRMLALGDNGVSEEGVAMLANSTFLVQLQELRLSWNLMGDEGAVILAQSSYLQNLRVLALAGTGIGDDGVEALAYSRNLRGVRRLDLGENEITDEGAVCLASSQHLGELRELDVLRCQLQWTGRMALRESTNFHEDIVLHL